MTTSSTVRLLISELASELCGQTASPGELRRAVDGFRAAVRTRVGCDLRCAGVDAARLHAQIVAWRTTLEPVIAHRRICEAIAIHFDIVSDRSVAFAV